MCDACETLVATCHGVEQCARSRSRSVRPLRSTRHRALAKTVGGAEPSTEERAVSLGDVDADVLHQPRRQASLAEEAQDTLKGERRVARSVRPAAAPPLIITPPRPRSSGTASACDGHKSEWPGSTLGSR